MTHQLGIGGATYFSCNPIGPPSSTQGFEAAHAWVSGRSGFTVDLASCGNPFSPTRVVEAYNGATWAVWAYSGPNGEAGHALSGSGSSIFCPTSSDPNWN